MRLYLTLGSIPEITDLSPVERRRAWRYAARRIWFRPLPLCGMILVTFALVLFVKLAVAATERSLLWSALLVLPTCAVVGLLWGSLLAHCARPYLREFRSDFTTQESPSNVPAA
jgi:hypothetical protein